MSLFDFELPHLQGVILDTSNPPSAQGSGGIASGAPNGAIYYNGSLFSIVPTSTTASGLATVPAVQQLAAAVTNSNPTSATALMTYVFPAGSLNAVGRTLDIFAAGEMTTGTGTTTTVAVTFGDGTNTRTLFTATTGALTTGQTSLPWNIFLDISVATAGTSGALFGHGVLAIPLTAPSAANAAYNDQNTANSSSLNLTKAITMSVTSLFGSSNSSNSVTQDYMTISVAN